ncbi:MAG: DUF58 domain-containing protein [Planctomycetota bacterium]
MLVRVVIIFILVGATLAFELGLLAYAVYVLAGLVWMSHGLARSWSKSVSVRRECLRTTAEVGQVIPVRLEISNLGRWPIGWVLVEDLLPEDTLVHSRLQLTGERLLLCGLRAGEKRSIYYQVKCRRRGYYQLGPSIVETGDWFGLERRFAEGAEPNFLLVYPEVLSIEGYDIASRRPMGEVRLTHRLFEDPTRIAGVRAYQPGDPLNRIHWRATARTGQLHSKVYEASTVAGAALLLDFHRASYDPRHEPVRSELAITTAASVANCLFQLGQQVGLLTNGRDAADRVRLEGWARDWRTRDAARASVSPAAERERLRPLVLPPQTGPERFREILEALARVELSDGLDFAAFVGEVESRLPRDATLIAILSSVPETTALALVGLKRRGFAVAALINLYDDHAYAVAAGPLIAAGIDARQLRGPDDIRAVCRRQLVG